MISISTLSVGSATLTHGSSFSLAHERISNVQYAVGESAVIEVDTILTS